MLIFLYAAAANIANIFYKYLFDGLGTQPVSYLFQILAILIGIKILEIAFHAAAYFISDKYMFEASRDLRVDVFEHLHALDFSFHSNKKSGSLISNIKRGDGAFFSINHELIRGVFKIIIDFIFILITFAIFDINLVVFVAVTVIISMFLMVKLISANIERRNDFNKEEDNISHIIVDNMINYDTVKYFAKEKQEKQRLLDAYVPWMSSLWRYANNFRLIDISTGLLTTIGSGIVIGYGLYQASVGLLSIGDVILIITFVTRFFPEITSVIYRLRDVAKSYIDLEKYLRILDYEITVPEAENAVELTEVKGEIHFKNINFQYHERENVFNNIDLRIEAGQSVAFVGESGAGKTTLTKLLLRFYDVDSGEILIDGVNIKDTTKQSLRSHIGIVPQEPILFNDTIGYNISYGKDETNIKEIKQATKIANLDEFIEELPHGYDTIVGERGIKLSGGQKQRLAIARVFLENPPIIIFDEATSQLDSASEKKIQDAFWQLAEKKTALIIAHRLSTVMRADRIVVLDKGRIVQDGLHHELIKQPGIYQKLWNLQSGESL